jgi:heptosyltransferase-1
VRIVLVRLSALGDIVHTWPLAVALRAERPDAHLTWVVEEPLVAMVDGHPAVDSVVTVDTRRWRRAPLSADTRARAAILRGRFQELQPDLAIDPQGVFKSALVTRWTGASHRVGLARPWRRERLAGLAYNETVAGSLAHRHVVASNLELVRAVGGVPPSELTAPDGGWLLERLADRPAPVAPVPEYVALLPGTGRSDKLLPIDGLAAVARRAAEAGFRVQILWGPGERDRAQQVVDVADGCAQLAPPTDLEGLVQVLAGARAVVGGDTGPIHLGASLGAPVLAVFTTTDWRRNGPLGNRVEVVSGATDRDAGPTGSSRAARPGAVTADQMVAGLERLLAPM